MDLTLNNLQRLICHKTQTTYQSVSGLCIHSLGARNSYHLRLKYVGIGKTANIEAVNHCFDKKIITSGFIESLNVPREEHIFSQG